MSDRLVIDSSPLISLARAELLELASKLPYEVVCPLAVQQEIRAGAGKGNLADVPEWVTPLALSEPLDPALLRKLQQGESAVIQLALEQGIQAVCIDERRGRGVAKAAGLTVIGTLGLLELAKWLGLVPQVAPLIRQLLAAGIYYDAQLLETLLRKFGEE